jgi:uncharacterized protein (UPF0332 family)
MNFDWKDYLKVAVILHDGASKAKLEEAMYRIAISRAYYAAFCTARNHKIDKGAEMPFEDAHKFVVDGFRYSKKEEERAIGQRLHRLKNMRVQADYDDEVDDVADMSSKAIKLAQEALDALAKLK